MDLAAVVSLRFQFRASEVDAQTPSGVVQSFERGSLPMFPVGVAVARKPGLEPDERPRLDITRGPGVLHGRRAYTSDATASLPA